MAWVTAEEGLYTNLKQKKLLVVKGRLNLGPRVKPPPATVETQNWRTLEGSRKNLSQASLAPLRIWVIKRSWSNIAKFTPRLNWNQSCNLVMVHPVYLKPFVPNTFCLRNRNRQIPPPSIASTLSLITEMKRNLPSFLNNCRMVSPFLKNHPTKVRHTPKKLKVISPIAIWG